MDGAIKSHICPVKNKIVIVQEFISDISDENTVTLDDYFAGKDSPIFSKIDVEGSEERVLNRSKRLFEYGELNKSLHVRIIMRRMKKNWEKSLRSYNYMTNPSSGYMLISMYEKLKPLDFRGGLLRCESNESIRNFQRQIHYYHWTH